MPRVRIIVSKQRVTSAVEKCTFLVGIYASVLGLISKPHIDVSSIQSTHQLVIVPMLLGEIVQGWFVILRMQDLYKQHHRDSDHHNPTLRRIHLHPSTSRVTVSAAGLRKILLNFG